MAPPAGSLDERHISGAVPLALFVPLSFLSGVAQLAAYRVLMVWVYDRTESLLVATLMHASLTASTVFLFTPLTTGVPFIAFSASLAAALWVVVAVVAVVNGRQSSRPWAQRKRQSSAVTATV